MFDVAIIGAGIIGLAHAYVAAKSGKRVAVFERNPAASGASIRNFGMVWPIGQPPGELYQLALRSRELWLEVLQQAGLPYLPTGSLHAAYAEDEAQVGREFAERAPALGYDCAWLSPEETLRSPALAPENLHGALWSPTELTVDPRQVIRELPHFLSKKYNVEFQFNTAVVDARQLQAKQIIIAAGDDFQTLYPEHFATLGLTRCKLQMLRTVAQPVGWQLGPSLAFGLTFRHYPTFELCPSLAALKQRVAKETPEFDQFGIHVMASQTAQGEITLGDSHEYGLAVEIFDKPQINALILKYASERMRVPTLAIGQAWHGVYAKHPTLPYVRVTPEPNVQAIVVTSGIGMTLSFGLAEQTLWL